MMGISSIQEARAPIAKSVTVSGSQSAVFARFVERIGAWWPLDKGHSVFGAAAARCAIDPFVGGEIFEESRSGERAVWGTVQVWEPPARLVFTWHPGRAADTAQTVEVSFTAIPEGVRVDLEHRDWHRYGPGVDQAHPGYDTGWDRVLGVFGAHFARTRQRGGWYTELHGRAAHVRIEIAAPLERVFDLIATAEGLDQWFTAGSQLDPQPGGRLVFAFAGAGPEGEMLENFGRVIAWDRPSRFAFQWEADIGTYDLVCTMQLAATERGTRIDLREEGFRDDAIGLQDLLNRHGGWSQELLRLKAYAEHGVRV